jgi:hypothetical protein
VERRVQRTEMVTFMIDMEIRSLIECWKMAAKNTGLEGSLIRGLLDSPPLRIRKSRSQFSLKTVDRALGLRLR